MSTCWVAVQSFVIQIVEVMLHSVRTSNDSIRMPKSQVCLVTSLPCQCQRSLGYFDCKIFVKMPSSRVSGYTNTYAMHVWPQYLLEYITTIILKAIDDPMMNVYCGSERSIAKIHLIIWVIRWRSSWKTNVKSTCHHKELFWNWM